MESMISSLSKIVYTQTACVFPHSYLQWMYSTLASFSPVLLQSRRSHLSVCADVAMQTPGEEEMSLRWSCLALTVRQRLPYNKPAVKMSYSCLCSLLLFVAFVGCVEACISCTVWLVSSEYEMLLCAVLMGIRLLFPSDLSFPYARVEHACWEAQL